MAAARIGTFKHLEPLRQRVRPKARPAEIFNVSKIKMLRNEHLQLHDVVECLGRTVSPLGAPRCTGPIRSKQQINEPRNTF